MIGKRVGLKNSMAKKVNQYDKQGNFIKTWDYITLAAKELKIDISSISHCCYGKIKSCGGFKWKFTDISHDVNFDEIEADEHAHERILDIIKNKESNLKENK